MINLPNECLFEILNNLKYYPGSLFSCLLVNREWCKIVIPILWSEINISSSRCDKPIGIYLLALNSEEKSLLLPFNIVIPNDPKPLFKYQSYAIDIKICSNVGVEKWLSHNYHYLNNDLRLNAVQ